ncbi:hypothetical protein [Mycolicibacterium sp.]|uniref:DUF7159 family protein n=1 Tax=Mycolicibacterium sp. TaxID=2320850 RepID=UPI001A1FFEF0|nr:hypothetical protein [Mycolicibacterium sp.]MBJ7339320.1 hypothetical protein [Mycolicibacterium sp.]
MDLVLGLSLTTAAVRWVLVEGTTGEGEPVDRGELVIPDIDSLDADLLLHAVLNPDVVDESRIRVVGVTSTREADPAAAAVVNALAARGHRNVASISDAAAVAALASGIVAITEYDAVAVCIVEPDSAFVALVDGGEVTVEHVDRPPDRADALELTSSVITVLDGRHVEAIFVIGSDEVDVIVSSFEAIADAPVFSASEADLALARGAALAAARTLDMSGPEIGGLVRRPSPRVGVLAAVLAAAVVTLVVSSSIALGLNLAEHPAASPENVSAAAESTPRSVPRPAAQPLVAFPNASRALAKTMVAKAPPAPAPVYAPPPVAAPPVYQAPAPVYVPPPQKPRLRDRIIERIPIIGRFHEPGQ